MTNRAGSVWDGERWAPAMCSPLEPVQFGCGVTHTPSDPECCSFCYQHGHRFEDHPAVRWEDVVPAAFTDQLERLLGVKSWTDD